VPDPDLFNVRSFRFALRTAGIGFGLGLVLMLLDVLMGIQLPQPFRMGVPWLLIVSSGVGITLLVGALGMPTRTPPDDNNASA
jgi:hypothetical protein